MALFNCTSYVDYLHDRFEKGTHATRGSKAKLAKAMGIHSSYLALVLNKGADLNTEQGALANEFFEHSELESEYFLVLIQHKRAGNQALKKHLEKKLQKLSKEQLQLKNRFDKIPTLDLESQNIYYSQWLYAAIHTIVSIKAYSTIPQIAQRLRLKESTVQTALNFLNSINLVMHDEKGWRIGKGRIHLGADSPLISQHHENWRQAAIRSLIELKPTDLHYSSVVTLSNKDAEKIREVLVLAIANAKNIIRDSPEETIYGFNCDFFEL